MEHFIDVIRTENEKAISRLQYHEFDRLSWISSVAGMSIAIMHCQYAARNTSDAALPQVPTCMHLSARSAYLFMNLHIIHILMHMEYNTLWTTEYIIKYYIHWQPKIHMQICILITHKKHQRAKDVQFSFGGMTPFLVHPQPWSFSVSLPAFMYSWPCCVHTLASPHIINAHEKRANICLPLSPSPQ